LQNRVYCHHVENIAYDVHYKQKSESDKRSSRVSVTDKLIHNVYKHGEQSYIQNVDKRDIFNWEDDVIHKKVNDGINKSHVLFNNSHVFISFAIRQKTLFQGFAVSHK
jgi:hypothetical protein